MVSYNAWLFQRLTAALNISQGFSLVAKGAIGRVLFPPLMKEDLAGELETH
jgi:hypothetical protein